MQGIIPPCIYVPWNEPVQYFLAVKVTFLHLKKLLSRQNTLIEHTKINIICASGMFTDEQQIITCR